MTGVLIREKRQRFKTQKHREGSHGRLEQRLKLYSPSQGMPRVTRSRKRPGRILPQSLQRPRRHLDFRRISRTVREYIFVVLRHQVCGNLCQQPQETNINGRITLKNCLAVSYMVKHRTTTARTKQTPGCSSKRNENADLYMNGHSRFLHNSPKPETIQMFSNS